MFVPNSLILEAVVLDKSPRIGSPLNIRIMMRNTSRKYLTVFNVMVLNYNLDVLIQDRNGKEIPYEDLKVIVDIAAPSQSNFITLVPDYFIGTDVTFTGTRSVSIRGEYKLLIKMKDEGESDYARRFGIKSLSFPDPTTLSVNLT